nr:MAG TPA: Colipase [Caudoviricetes sp.]
MIRRNLKFKLHIYGIHYHCPALAVWSVCGIFL